MEQVLAILIGIGATAHYFTNAIGYSLLGTALISGLAFLLFLAYRNIIKHYP